MQPPIDDQFDPEDMEAWLAEVELVHEKIKRLSSEQSKEDNDDDDLKELRQKREIHEKKKVDAQRQLQSQKEDQERKGRKGKGQNRDYVNYCKYCQLEYVKPMEKCYWCKRLTLTCQERYDQLLEKVHEYKQSKVRKQEKKQKFDMMEKTEKMLWKKSTFTHRKWDYYTSSEEEIESEPIVPKDDPNFKALEMDMEQRKKKRDEDMKKAEELKARGNKYYSEGQYDHAAWKYSEALELVKDNKTLWLNRAISYIKLNKNKKAISDCTRVIEYAECFENGYTQSRENCFKAFARRALAYYNRDRLTEAKNDIDEALKLIPNDKEAQTLKKEIEAKIEHYERLKQIEKQNEQEQEQQNKEDTNQEPQIQISYKELIDKFTSGQQVDLLQLLKVMRLNQNEATAYFYDKKGIENLIELIKNKEKLHDAQNIVASLPALILQSYQEKNLIYQEQFLIQYNGVELLVEKIKGLLVQAAGKTSTAIYDCVTDYIETINCMDEEKPRNIIQKNQTLIAYVYPELFKQIVPLYKSEKELVSKYFSLCSNLCYGQGTLFKQKLILDDQFLEPLINIYKTLELKLGSRRVFSQLCNWFANILTEESLRIKFLSPNFNKNFFPCFITFLRSLQFKEKDYTELKENALAVLVNLTFQITPEQSKYASQLNFISLLIDFLDTQREQVVIERVLTVLSKVNYEDNIFIVTKYLKQYSSPSIRCLIQWLSLKSTTILEQLKKNESQLYELLGELRQLLYSESEIIFCNSCNAIGLIIDLLSPVTGEMNPCFFFNQIIPRLLTFVKDRTGNFRKNSAILLAKLTKDQKNLKNLRDLHGVEILQSVMGKM